MGGMPADGLPSVSSSSDPAQGTCAGARRSMRHANSPRLPRLILSPRRFRHTALSPPSYISHAPAAHGGRGAAGGTLSPPPLTAGDGPPGEPSSHRSGRDSLIFANFASVKRFASSRE